MKRLALATLLAACLVAIPSPSHAVVGAVMTHYAPDDGYDNGFYVSCWYPVNKEAWVDEGTSSRQDCEEGGIVTSVYVFPGQEIWCWYSGVNDWVKWADATGGYSMGGANRTCVSRAD